METARTSRTRVGAAALALMVSACAVAQFSPEAVTLAQGIRAEALALIDQATDDFAGHAAAAGALRQRMDGALAQARGRSDNEESIRQWELMADPSGNLLGGFLTRWESNGRLSRALIGGIRQQVAVGLDLIVETENAKREE